MIVCHVTAFLNDFGFLFIDSTCLFFLSHDRCCGWHTFFHFIAAGGVVCILIQLVGSVGSSAVKQ